MREKVAKETKNPFFDESNDPETIETKYFISNFSNNFSYLPSS